LKRILKEWEEGCGHTSAEPEQELVGDICKQDNEISVSVSTTIKI
jgi:hypothetical protein